MKSKFNDAHPLYLSNEIMNDLSFIEHRRIALDFWMNLFYDLRGKQIYINENLNEVFYSEEFFDCDFNYECDFKPTKNYLLYIGLNEEYVDAIINFLIDTLQHINYFYLRALLKEVLEMNIKRKLFKPTTWEGKLYWKLYKETKINGKLKLKVISIHYYLLLKNLFEEHVKVLENDFFKIWVNDVLDYVIKNPEVSGEKNYEFSKRIDEICESRIRMLFNSVNDYISKLGLSLMYTDEFIEQYLQPSEDYQPIIVDDKFEK